MTEEERRVLYRVLRGIQFVPPNRPEAVLQLGFSPVKCLSHEEPDTEAEKNGYK